MPSREVVMSLPSRAFLSLSLHWRKDRSETLEPTKEPIWSRPVFRTTACVYEVPWAGVSGAFQCSPVTLR